MGKALSIAFRPLKNYNVQNRAHKLLDSDKPRVPPRHPSDRQVEGTKHGLDQFQKKDDDLLSNLKSVYVVTQESMTSKDSLDGQGASESRPLPSYRRAIEHPPIGYVEPKQVPEGKVSLVQAITFIMEHQSNPEKVTAKTIANTHRLDEDIVENVLKHFSAFELHMPAQEEEVTVVERIAQLPKMLLPKSGKGTKPQS